MRRFIASTVKELLLIVRDKAGMMLLFLMPVALVFIMSIVMDAALNVMNDNRIPVLLVDHDRDTLSQKIRDGILQSGNFDLVEIIDGDTVSPEMAHSLVAAGDYQVGIVLPEGASDTLRSNANAAVKKSFYKIGMFPECPKDTIYDSVDIAVFYDPGLRATSRTAISAMVAEHSVRTEAHMVYRMYAEILNMMLPEGVEFKSDYPETVIYNETYASEPEATIVPNSVQHNVPSWTLFAMFFIIIPLSSSLIKEKEEGSYLRLISMPGSFNTIFFGKMAVYMLVAVLQFLLMLFVGIYLIPLMGLPALVIGQDYLALACLVMCSALAAISFGLLIGGMASTQQQAAAFGASMVIIMASVGGLFMPSYMMPASVRHISELSPMYWAHESFQDLFIRDAHLATIAPRLIKLMIFAGVCFLLALVYKRLKKAK